MSLKSWIWVVWDETYCCTWDSRVSILNSRSRHTHLKKSVFFVKKLVKKLEVPDRLFFYWINCIIRGELRFFSMYLLKSRISILLHLFAMLGSSPIRHHPTCAELKKDEPHNWRTPSICDLMHSSNFKANRILRMSCHGGVIRKWRDIVRFFVSQGYTDISTYNASTVIVKNEYQPWTSLEQWRVHQFLARRSHVNQPNFIAQHSTPCECGGARRTRRAYFFSQKFSPGCRIVILLIQPWRWLVHRFSCTTRSSQACP